MRQMFSLNQLIALIQKYAPGFDPSDVEAGTLISALGLNADGVLKKQALAGMFDGKYVRVVNASEISGNLTETQKAMVKNGIFVNGELLNFINPVIFPSGGYMIIFGQVKNTNNYAFKSAYFYPGTNKILIYGSTNIEINAESHVVAIGSLSVAGKNYPSYPSATAVGQYICRKGTLMWYVPVSQTGISSGDTIALDSALGKALLDHLEVEINGYRARYEYTDGNYVIYSSKAEADGGLKLQVNMISYNTTNGELSFNQMTFTPDA